MNYPKKYQALIDALRIQNDVLDSAKLEQFIQRLDREVTEKRRTHKQAFFTLLQTYITIDVDKPERDQNKRKLEMRLRALDDDGNDMSDHSSETDSQEGESKKPVNLISEDDDLFVFLYKNAKPLLSERELNAILHPFLTKEEADEEAEHKKHKHTNWLLSVMLYHKLQQSKLEAERKRIQRVLLGYLSRKTNNEDIDHVVDTLKELNAYFSIDDIIFHRMVPDKVKRTSQLPHGPYQNTFLDEMRTLISGHHSHADIKRIKKYDTRFRIHSCRFIEMVKLLYKELRGSEKLRLREFIRKLNTFDKKVRKYNVILGLQPNLGGGLSAMMQSPSPKNKKLEAKIAKEADALLAEAHQLFDTCMPGTVSYHIMAIAFLALGFALVIAGISLRCFRQSALQPLGRLVLWSLCGNHC